MTISWPLSRQQVLDLNGHPRLDVRASFFQAGTDTPLAVFTDPGRTQPHPAVIAPDATGRFPRVYLPDGLYKERVFSTVSGLLWSDDALGVPVATPGTTNPTTPTDPTAIAATGDVKWRLDGSVQPGWVRMNGGSLGNGASGASERANPDAKPLYLYLWQTFGDATASVVGGRGNAALDDFNAGKVILIPSMRGLVAAGLDDMGAGAANRLQTATNLTLTAGATTATVASAAGLVIGMYVIAAGLPAGTYVTDLSGTTVSLSAAAAAGASGQVAGRFSVFPDAQAPGNVGGQGSSVLRNKNLPVTLPGGSVTVSYPSHGYRKTKEGNQTFFNGQNSGGTVVANNGADDAQTTPPGPQTFAVSQANPDGGVPIATLQPTRLGTYYLKL